MSEYSKRSELLKRVLPHINAGRYDEDGRYIVFGTTSIWELIADQSDFREDQDDHAIEDAVSKLASDSTVFNGRRHIADRASLDQKPRFKSDALDGLSPEQRTTLHDALVQISSEHQSRVNQSPSRRAPDVHDLLDAALAEEMLGKLPKAVDRAVRLEELALDRIPSQTVRNYFNEAHRCYIYGFPVACSVLCRAILASALENVCDPRRKIHARTPRGDSYFKILVERATADGFLMDDRPEWAIRVRDAGNDAVHDFPVFMRRWEGKLDEILLNTRKILFDLYAEPR